jgi:hypothetical protein
MENDADYCRAQAQTCMGLANLISAEDVRAYLFEKGRGWLRMADSHDRASNRKRAEPHSIAIT